MQIQFSFSIFAYNQTNERMKFIKWQHSDSDKRTPEQIRRDDVRMTWAVILFPISAVSFIMVVLFFILHYLTAAAYCLLVSCLSFSIALDLAITVGVHFISANSRSGGTNPWDLC